MARQRNYRAEYQRRVELARERGLTAAQGYGKAKRSGLPSVSELRASGALPPRPSSSGRKRERRPTVSIDTPAGKVHRTGDQRVVRRLVEQAAAEGKRVTIRAKFQTETGEWRTATLGADGGTSALLGQALNYGDEARKLGQKPSSGDRPGALRPGGRPEVEVRIGGTTGMDAAELLALLALYASVWDALRALFLAVAYR